MKKQHCVVMDDELSQELKIVAIKMGISMSDLISKACVEYLRWRNELIEHGLIFEDARDIRAAINSRYGAESHQYTDTDKIQQYTDTDKIQQYTDTDKIQQYTDTDNPEGL